MIQKGFARSSASGKCCGLVWSAPIATALAETSCQPAVQPLRHEPAPQPAAIAVEAADEIERILDATAPLGERADWLRTYLRRELGRNSSELQCEIQSVRDEVGNIDAEVDRRFMSLRNDVEALRDEVAELWRARRGRL
jgi:hypothetical protein